MQRHEFDTLKFLIINPDTKAIISGVSVTLMLPLLKIRAEQDPLPLTDRIDRRIMTLQFVQNPTDDGDTEKTFRVCSRCGAPIVHGVCAKCGESMKPDEYAGLVAVPEKVERFVRDLHPGVFSIDPVIVRGIQRNILATAMTHSSFRAPASV